VADIEQLKEFPDEGEWLERCIKLDIFQIAMAFTAPELQREFVEETRRHECLADI
jgi:hypothetical protein